jgi:hypothetical protein
MNLLQIEFLKKFSPIAQCNRAVAGRRYSSYFLNQNRNGYLRNWQWGRSYELGLKQSALAHLLSEILGFHWNWKLLIYGHLKTESNASFGVKTMEGTFIRIKANYDLTVNIKLNFKNGFLLDGLAQ